MSTYLKMYRWGCSELVALVVAPTEGEAWCALKNLDLMAYAYLYSGNYLPHSYQTFDERLANGGLRMSKGFPLRPREMSLGFCTDGLPERTTLWRENGYVDPPSREFYGEVFWK